ncbi:MAG: hypothetical protein NTX52_03100 [Planctomycetota bacterium]|nr:hypothetical protein [Planctomycetota bacterium]
MIKLSKVKKPSRQVLAKVHSISGHAGEVAVIEPISSKVFIDENLTLAMRKARDAYPGKVFYCLRLGSESLYTHKGITRKSKQKRIERSL